MQKCLNYDQNKSAPLLIFFLAITTIYPDDQGKKSKTNFCSHPKWLFTDCQILLILPLACF